MTDQAIFISHAGETVTAFALGPLEARYYPGVVRRGVDNVDYKFVNGFTDVGELPCRTAVRAEIAARGAVPVPDFEIVATNLPGFNRRLEFSGFWHRPTRLSRAVRTRLVPEASGDLRFRLSTCGGVHIFVDGKAVAAFEPYTRNAAQETEIALPLKAEGSDVVMLVEEMAERDTNYFVELTFLGPGTLAAVIPGNADRDTLTTLMALARSIHPAKVVFGGDEPLELAFDRPASSDVVVEARVHQSVHMRHLPPLLEARATLKAGSDRVMLALPASLPDDYHALDVTLSVGESRVHRDIAFALLREQSAATFADELETRKRLALSYLAEHGEQRPGRVLARLALGLDLGPACFAALDDTLTAIEDRRDCSDFVMVPLLWIRSRWADRLPANVRARIDAAILGYRYWMDEPGNDAMWFWSENHVLCFHVSELIAGRLFADAIFTNSGLLGREHAALAERRLARWFDAIEDHGLAEWNSAAYYPIDFIGLLALEHCVGDNLKARAKTVLDRLFTMIALHVINGVAAGTMGRAYDKELRAGPLSELAPFATVAFGRGWLNRGVAALPMFCAGRYAPPAGLEALVRPEDGQAVTARYVQGYGRAAQLSLYKTATMQLSASIDAAPGKKGHQQHLIDVQAAGHPMARVWVNHPGADDPWGEDRPSYWAGNGIMPRVAMFENIVLVLSDLGDNPRLAFTHAYAPLSVFDDCRTGPDWLALRAGGGFVLLKATGPILPVNSGPGAGIEHRVQGRTTGWAIMIGDLPDGDLAPVAELAEAGALRLETGPLRLVFTAPGRPELTLDYRDGLSVDGRPHPFLTQSQLPEIAWHAAATLPAKT
ncbi:hypothetical protein [Martelella sp. HB161492]|uniref:hypothetical protein n=1 Tax=Martelella sp. HB161492 TaxID=2720726 RepID=UPI00159188A4|nr:hypothetical protein [Martelella sp. HB161492]